VRSTQNAFSQLKASLKKFGDKTFDGLTSAVGRLLDATAAEY